MIFVSDNNQYMDSMGTGRVSMVLEYYKCVPIAIDNFTRCGWT